MGGQRRAALWRSASLRAASRRCCSFVLMMLLTVPGFGGATCGGSLSLGGVWSGMSGGITQASQWEGPPVLFAARPSWGLGLMAIYSALSTEMIFSIEYVCPTLWKVPITRHLSPTEQGFSGSWPEAARSIVHM